ncbi:MAG: 3D domain-containing protein [Acidobacteriaceae bacterium]|nr:3D domain-containing protein [Acidobacteriaceae bacterium]
MGANRFLLASSGRSVLSVALLLFLFSRPAVADNEVDGIFMATAYSVQGITASGQYTHRHVVAADPSILPIGSRIKIRHAGRYSGEYVVADTGMKIEGRKLDLYVASTKACRKFGSRPVRVRVVQFGDGTHAAAKQADRAVKEDVAKDLQKNAVGNAATADDWKTKSAGNNAAPQSAPPTSRATSEPK